MTFYFKDSFNIRHPVTEKKIDYEFINQETYTEILLKPDDSIDQDTLTSIKMYKNRFAFIPVEGEAPILPEEGKLPITKLYYPFYESETLAFRSHRVMLVEFEPVPKDEVSEEEIKSTEKTGSQVSTGITAFSTVGNSLGLIGIVSGADPSGTLMKMA